MSSPVSSVDFARTLGDRLDLCLVAFPSVADTLAKKGRHDVLPKRALEEGESIESRTYPKSPRTCAQYGCREDHTSVSTSLHGGQNPPLSSPEAFRHTPANTVVISKTRIPSNGAILPVDEDEADAKH